MSDALLQLNGLNAHYGDFQALYGINMDVHAGEVVAIIGANGAVLSQIFPLFEGRYSLDTVIQRERQTA